MIRGTPTPPTPARRTFTIVVADDIPLMRLMLSKYVNSTGVATLEQALGPVEIQTLEAGNGEEALELLARENVDLLFLDLMMPVKDGLTLIKEIRARRGLDPLKVVVCSAVGDRDVMARAVSMGADAYIVKPFTLRAVHDTLVEIYAPAVPAPKTS